MQGVITAFRDIAADIRQIDVRFPAQSPYTFQAGDYAFFSMDGFDPRPYSIASAPRNDNSITLYIKHSGRGLSDKLCRGIEIGDAMDVSAPHRQFTLPDDTLPVALLAGGMGITPFLAMIEDYHADAPPLSLYWGVESEQDLYFLPFLEAQAKRLESRFDFHVCIFDRNGNVADAFLGNFHAKAPFHVFISGPGRMIDASVEKLLANGVAPPMIHYHVPAS